MSVSPLLQAALPLRADALEPFLETRELGRTFHAFDEIDSTNDEAHRLAAKGASHGTLVVADAQSKGRGRRGRSWTTPKGRALAMSLVLRPHDLPSTRAPELAFAGAIAVCQGARALGAKTAALKWPNDVQCEGKKLSGMLAELRTQGQKLSHVVLGIGINVNVELVDLPPALRATATSLLIETGAPISRALACATVLNHLERWLDEHAREGFGPLRARWKELAATLGKRVRVEGETPISGLAEDMDEDGALLVRTDDGQRHRVVVGDVEHLRLES